MEESWHQVYVGLGSNLPQGASQKIVEAIKGIESTGNIKAFSTIYTTRPINPKSTSDNDYHNAVVFFETHIPLDEYTVISKELEDNVGRNQSMGFVGIDIDIVVWDGKILRPIDFEREYFQLGYRQIMEKCREQV